MNRQCFLLLSFSILMASPAPAQSRVQPDSDEQLKTMARYLRNVHKPYTESVKVGMHGQNDVLFQTRESWDQIVGYYQDAYRNHSKLPDNVVCKGWLVIHAKRRATFTLYQGSNKFMVVAEERPDGTQLKLYGFAYRQGGRKVKKRPYHRGLPERRVRRYGI